MKLYPIITKVLTEDTECRHDEHYVFRGRGVDGCEVTLVTNDKGKTFSFSTVNVDTHVCDLSVEELIDVLSKPIVFETPRGRRNHIFLFDY